MIARWAVPQVVSLFNNTLRQSLEWSLEMILKMIAQNLRPENCQMISWMISPDNRSSRSSFHRKKGESIL